MLFWFVAAVIVVVVIVVVVVVTTVVVAVVVVTTVVVDFAATIMIPIVGGFVSVTTRVATENNRGRMTRRVWVGFEKGTETPR